MTATTATARRHRPLLLWLLAARSVLLVLAFPLAAVLYSDHFLLLLAMRPTKDVLLLGSFLVQQDSTNLIGIVLVAVPLAMAGGILTFAVGRSHRDEIRRGELPYLQGRLLSPDTVKSLERAVRKRGPLLILFGRIAIFPSNALASAAGAAGVPLRTFVLADAAGVVISTTVILGVGSLLGSAFQNDRHFLWVTGLVAFVVVGIVVGKHLRRP